MEIQDTKIPNRTVCGVCQADLGKSDEPEGELGYDGCEEPYVGPNERY